MSELTPAEKREARLIIAIQAGTMPLPNENGEINIGPSGAWKRAEHVQVDGRKVHDRMNPRTR